MSLNTTTVVSTSDSSKDSEPAKKSSAEKVDDAETGRLIKNQFLLFIQLFYILFITSIYKIPIAVLRHALPYGQAKIKDTIVVVVGAGSSLGRQLSIEFAKLGGKVVCVDGDEASNQETVNSINKIFPNHAFAYTTKLSTAEEIRSVATNIDNEIGTVQFLIIANTLLTGGHFAETNDDQFNSIIKANLIEPFKIIRQFLPQMQEKKVGHIAIISSTAALSSIQNATIYTASEWAAAGLAEGLYQELRLTPGNRIKISFVCSYFVNDAKSHSSKLNLRISPLSLEEACQSIITGIRKEKRLFSVPRHLYYLHIIQRLLPDNLNNSLNDVLYVKYEVQSSTTDTS